MSSAQKTEDAGRLEEGTAAAADVAAEESRSKSSSAYAVAPSAPAIISGVATDGRIVPPGIDGAEDEEGCGGSSAAAADGCQAGDDVSFSFRGVLNVDDDRWVEDEFALRRAVRDSVRTAAGAYRVAPVGGGTTTVVATRTGSGGGGDCGAGGPDDARRGRNASDGDGADRARGTAASSETLYGPSLPPNIDVVAEATLVRDGDDDDGDAPGGIRCGPSDEFSAVAARPPSTADLESSESARRRSVGWTESGRASEGARDAVCEPAAAAAAASGGANRAAACGGGGGSGSPETPAPAPSEAIATAEAMDKLSVVLCGKLFRFRWWHAGLLALAVGVCIVVPMSVVRATNDEKEADPANGNPPPLTDTVPQPSWVDNFFIANDGSNSVINTEELRSAIEATVVPSTSRPEDLEDPDSPQSRAVDWMSSGGGYAVVEAATLEEAERRIRQRYVLAVLYYATEGEGWKNQFGYLDDTLHECDWGDEWNGWMSTDCNDVDEIKLINLWQNNLGGTIPRELASLPSLNTIDFFTNKIGGTVPEELTAMNLEYLNLGYNQLTGTVHASYGNLNNITYLMMDYNKLRGTIPPELGKLTQLSGWLSLEDNDLTGTIPESFVNFTQATWIYLNGNDLTGSAEFLCDALNPQMTPNVKNAINATEESPLLELWVDRDEVTCSCCNCCPKLG